MTSGWAAGGSGGGSSDFDDRGSRDEEDGEVGVLKGVDARQEARCRLTWTESPILRPDTSI